MFRFHHLHTPISSQTQYLVGVPPWLSDNFLLFYIYPVKYALTQRIFFVTAITELSHTLPSYDKACESCMYYRLERPEGVHCVPAIERSSLKIHSTPADISSFSCTRSVRLVPGLITKWLTCRTMMESKMHSSRTEFAESCARGPRATSFLLFSTTKLCKIPFYSLFYTITHDFASFPSWRP